jgi:inositol polyphosphate-4-phosphatase
MCSLEFRHPQALSPYRRITQQLNFDVKSPDLDDLVTPDSPHCTRVFWSLPPNGTVHKAADADAASITALKSYGSRSKDSLSGSETQFEIFPDSEEGSKNGSDQNAGDENEKEELMNSQDRLENCNDVSDVDDRSVGMSNGFDCDLGRRFLDTQAMCNSPSANYYKPTDEPEPWDLTQLNIEASVMCLVSKVKFLCGRCGSPAVRLRSSQRGLGRSRSFRGGLSNQSAADEGSGKDSVVTVQPTSTSGGSNIANTGDIVERNAKEKTEDEAQRLESIGLSASMSSDDVINKAVDTVQKAVNGAVGRNCFTVRNKFTEGLDFASIVDWTSELRPSMRKLRQAMDGLLKTARLTHSVFRVQEDVRAAQRACNVRYRRDVCFSQAVSSSDVYT